MNHVVGQQEPILLEGQVAVIRRLTNDNLLQPSPLFAGSRPTRKAGPGKYH
jgi:hypothetical protein